jgi:5-methylcytosine-specific restriction endonuclease McrA
MRTASSAHPLGTRSARVMFNKAMRRKGVQAKVCGRCLVVKGHAAFAVHGSAPDGRQPYCRECSLAYKAADREKVRAQFARRRARRAARIEAQIIADRMRTRPNGLKNCRRCRVSKPFENFSSDITRVDGLRDACRTCATTAHRRACRAVHGSPVGAECYLCACPIDSEADAHTDHLIPQSLGGSDEPENLRWTHARCNISRGASRPDDAAYWRAFAALAEKLGVASLVLGA